LNNNKLILGTVQFGLNYGINNNEGKPSKKKVKDILDYAYLNGIRFLDTAEAYGDSQIRIGEYHRLSTNKYNVITKFFPQAKNMSKKIYERVNNNISNLGINELYCYMFHSFKDYNDYFTIFKKDLNLLKQKGKIKKIGVSIYSNDELKVLIKNNDIDLVQLPFNLLDNSRKREKILLKAKSLNIEIHTRSVFLQGLFFKDQKNIPVQINKLIPYLKKINSLTTKSRLNDLALNYVYSKDYIDHVLIGVDNVDQLKSNINSLEKCSTKNKFAEIDKINVKDYLLLNPSNWKL
tara:strand:+ start:926 stop:1801 length:876 start_codon:yes stop_codon:yes gene_type:complete